MDSLMSQLDSLTSELAARIDRAPLLSRLTNGSISEGGMAVFVVQTYHYVKWTCPLLKGAAKRLARISAGAEWVTLFDAKAREERHHDRWLLRDAAALGWSEAAVKAARPSLSVEAYVAYNKAIVNGAQPLGYLGTAWALEKLAVDRAGVAVATLLKSPSPKIARALTFLKRHAEADIGHTGTLAKILEAIIDPLAKSSIITAARMVLELYPSFFEDELR